MNEQERDSKIAKLRRMVKAKKIGATTNQCLLRRNQLEAREEVEDQNPFGIDDDRSDEEQDHRKQRRLPRKRESDMKVELREFDGKMQGVAFIKILLALMIQRSLNMIQKIEEAWL